MKILPVFIPHAGCAHACIFCDQASTGGSAAVPTPAEVGRQVESALRSGATDEVAFYGGSFTALPVGRQQEYLASLQPFLRQGLFRGIRLSTRPDAVDGRIVERLLAAGVTTVELGCQSFCDAVLSAAGRGHDSRDAVRSAALLRAAGVRLGIQLMPGLPGGDCREALASLNRALELRPDFLRVYPAVVIAGTGLERLWRNGEYAPLSLDDAVELCADMEVASRNRGVPVIRYGLQANDALSGGRVLAGPYHPAFGQMVKSRLWRRAMARLLPCPQGAFGVHPAELSDAIGHRRENLLHFNAAHSPVRIGSSPGVRKGCLAAGRDVYELDALLRAEGDGK